MDEIKVSQLDAVDEIKDTDQIMLVTGGANKKVLGNYINEHGVKIGSSEPDTSQKVWFKKSNNLFNKNTFVIGDITNGNTTIRLSSRQALYLEAGTYTFSTTQPNTFQYNVTINSVGAPPLTAEPTFTYNSSWRDTTPFIFTLNTAGYLCIYIRKADNSSINLSEISNFNYYLISGNTATTEDYIAPSIIVDNIEFYSQEYFNDTFATKDTGWINFTNLSNWTNFSWEPIAYRKVGKVVYIHGGGTIGNYSDTTIATLPDGFRPRQNIDVICATNNSIAICKMHIGYNGSIAINYPSNANVKEVLLNTCFVAR